jgi:hypothetical protein
MAIESARVTADVVEANEFPELSERFAVSGVPKIVINDRVELLGAQREARFVEAVVQAVTPGGGDAETQGPGDVKTSGPEDSETPGRRGEGT